MSSQERELNVEITPLFIDSFAKTFISRRDCYPWQQADGSYISVHKPLTADLLQRHFKGSITLGAYALNSASMAQWICLDADDETQWDQLGELADTLQAQSIQSYREPSRRGGHLWLFTPPLPGIFARRFAKQLITENNVPQVELYPKQDELTTGLGSLVRLPLGVHRKSGQVYPFVNRDGVPISSHPTGDTRTLLHEQMAIFADPSRVPLPFIMRVLARVPPDPLPLPKLTPEFRTTHATDGLPLSERLKSQISVLEFVSHYVQLDDRNLGYCPFHDDQIRSFGVHPDQNYWHCFAGCGGGSIIDFWMKWRERNGQDSSFKATVTELRQMLL
ncbi:MAG: hypothetical protein LCI00_24435 [Chloroflexi bacterium]|nr:hypothetical protein [Chloroflexota bacterium]